ncbi:MAG: LysR family transcriptional regulator, partial [Christensenellaceae bacterium]|nr:LysR family transcriptional regulator [Christensenellaceae bacterium]
KLFERSNHRIVLTQDGLLLRRRAQEIVELTERTEKDFAHKDEELTGEIAIGSGETRSVSVLAEVLSSFRQRYPRVRYRFYSGNADHIKERIENGTLDIGLFPEPVDISRYEFIRVPVREEWGVLTQEDSPLGRLPFVRPENLVGRPLMISGREMVQHELANWFGDEFQKLDISVRYNLLYNVAMLVRNGFGDALCIRLDCQYPGLRFVPLHPPLAFGSVLVWKKHQVAFPAVSALIVHAKKCLSGILEHIE